MPSVFAPGSGGSLKSTTQPAAFLETASWLDKCENDRNSANPGITPKQNITVSIDLGTKVATIAATIPAAFSVDSTGNLVSNASDYIGATYSVFAGGGGALKSTDAPSAFVEMAAILAASEKAVVPAEDQPNNIQLTIEQETSSIVVSAVLPITAATAATGEIVIAAVDYF